MKISIGSDHAGYRLKQFLVRELGALDHDILDCGTDSESSVDYPDYASAACRKVTGGEARFAIIICSTGIGISIAANKIHGIRAALCHTEFSARMARQHNDANVLALGGGVIGEKLALAIAETFIADTFSEGERHKRRIDKITKLES